MTVKDNCFNFSMSWERGYSDDPDDSGNYYNGVLVGSNLGVTALDLAVHMAPVEPTAVDMKNLPKSTAEVIWSGPYWNQAQADHLPPCVAFNVVDFGYNAGIRNSIKILQRAIGFTSNDDVDGWVGGQTLNNVNNWSGPLPKFNAYGAGDYSAILRLQRYLGVRGDGIFGPVTLQALNTKTNSWKLILTCKLAIAQAEYYQSLTQFPKYGAGWMNRLWARLEQSLKQ
jgi:lysozyme family protein